MTIGASIRDPAEMRAEIKDLESYLNGLPDEVRYIGAFAAYEQRVGALSSKLVF
jgi:hypothetical protein